MAFGSAASVGIVSRVSTNAHVIVLHVDRVGRWPLPYLPASLNSGVLATAIDRTVNGRHERTHLVRVADTVLIAARRVRVWLKH